MKLLPWLVSLMVHSLIFVGGNIQLHQTVIGVTSGNSGMEVRLTAALRRACPLPSVPSSSMVPLADSERSPAPPQQPKPISPSSLPSSVQRASHSAPKNLSERKSNSSVRQNIRRNSASASSGAIVARQPDYLSNPAPVYPPAAQEERQQGLVILDVIVSTDGRSESVRVSSGSGYDLLDEAARQAVQNYRFRPATLNGVRVRSHVRVPIRFRLEE